MIEMPFCITDMSARYPRKSKAALQAAAVSKSQQ